MMTDYVTGVLLLSAGLLSGLMAALAAKHKARSDRALRDLHRFAGEIARRGHRHDCPGSAGRLTGPCDCGYAEAIESHGAEAH